MCLIAALLYVYILVVLILAHDNNLFFDLGKRNLYLQNGKILLLLSILYETFTLFLVTASL